MLKERRTSRRVKKNIFFRLLSPGVKERPSEDVSLGGLLIESNDFHEIDAKVGLELILQNEKPIYCQARVAWINPYRKNAAAYKIGLQFLNLSSKEEEKLKKAIY